MLYYAELNSDHERLVSHHVQRREWTKALDVLAKTSDPELFYRSGCEMSMRSLHPLSGSLMQLGLASSRVESNNHESWLNPSIMNLG